ncbi:MAG: DUF1016 N-terminal domain-containing protein [Lentisphaeraceae bacterium]|nr:DUF1016 N-terminal domain-containing protein [Lentisphaeraceae bacterium]
MEEQEDFNADDFIPADENNENEDVDIYELLFQELSSIMMDRDSSSVEVTAWMIGDKLRRVLGVISDNEKGKQAFALLQQQIESKYGVEFTQEKLHECIKIADEFPDLFLFSELTDHVDIHHIRHLINVDSDLARTYYSEMCKLEKWSADQLKEKIDAKAFEAEYGEDA